MRLWNGIGLATVLAAIAGCDPGPALVPATGRVLFNGKPLEGADVRLVGEGFDPPLANDLSGTTLADGTFVPNYRYGEEGVPAGRYKVGVVLFAVDMNNGGLRTGPNILPRHYADPNSSGLTVEIPEAGGVLPAIELSGRLK